MLTIAIIGNSNVGKTSLFNFLTNTKFSFINDSKNFTLDYNYGFLSKKYIILNKNIILIDTNSVLKFIFLNDKYKINYNFNLCLKNKFLNLIKNVNFIFFLVNSYFIMEEDKLLSRYLFKYNKNIILLLTKKDICNNLLNINEFRCLRINNIYYISIYYKNTIIFLLNDLFNKKKIINKKKYFYIKNINFCVNLDDNYYILKKYFFKKEIDNYNLKKIFIKMVIIGKDNVGKSSFLNFLCNNNRSLISKNNGYTKDFIMSLYINKNIYYLISDSPGLCKKKKNYNDIIFKINLNFNIILYMIDFNLNISKFDLKILNFLLKNGKYLLLLFNKCDNISYNNLLKYKNILIKRYDFIKYIDIYFFSCLNRNNLYIINNIFKNLYLNYLNIFYNKINNDKINNILNIFNKNNKKCIFNLRYTLICKYYPLIIIIYGNKINLINNSYKKKILNFYMKKLNFRGFKIFLKFKEIYNPYKKNKY